jgi:Hom_end-associated Hint/ATPase family associated with various cellular activities (AAA)
MEIVIKERIARRMRADLAEVQVFFAHAKKGWCERRDGEYEVDDDVVLDLSKLTANEVSRLHEALATSKILGTKVLAADVQKYLRAGTDGIEGMTARTVRQAAWLIEHTIASLPHHLLFSPDEYGGGSYVGYFVNDVDFTEEKHGRDGYEPPECDVTLVWIENDVRMSRTVNLKTEDVVGLGPEEILRRKGLVLETPELMARLRDETERYYQVREQVGKKHVARGIGLVDLDDAAEGKRSHVYRGRDSTIQLDLFGMTTPVVIDVLGETGEVDERRRRQPSVNVYRWHSWNLRFFSPSEDDLVRHLEADEDTDFEPATQVPVHPLVPCFDLRRHARLRVHLNNLEPYVFRRAVGDRLILPPRDRTLIEMLVDESANTFQDVVSGKGQSVNILSGGPAGTGKCLGFGTPVVMADGRVVEVQHVQTGDRLMGPDGRARTVLSTTTGRGPLYMITPVKGEPWVCNAVHVLTLVNSDTDDVIDIALDRWHAASANFRTRHKQFSVGVEKFEGNSPLPVDPYFLGVWFGDGSKHVNEAGVLRSIAVSKPDPEIRDVCRATAEAWGLHVREQMQTCMTYHLTTGNTGQSETNRLLVTMRDLLGPDLEMPDQYLRAPRAARLQFLAGLLDTDGELSGSYVITQRREDWARAIWWLARSLGFCSTIRTRIGRCPRSDGSVFEGTYWVVTISGDLDQLPLRISHKKASARRQIKVATRTGITTTLLGDGDYYGFTLDGDGRFLLGDFTVTHNTLTAEVLAEYKERPLYSVQCSQLGIDPETIEKNLAVVLQRANRWNAILLLDEADVYITKRGSSLQHNAIVGVFLRILEYAQCILIMTTNLAANVDDAIASRCIVRIGYEVPPPDDQIRIWRQLADLNAIAIDDGTILTFVAHHPRISGRDVKNLLKLASFVAKRNQRPVDIETLEFALQYKPTAS